MNHWTWVLKSYNIHTSDSIMIHDSLLLLFNLYRHTKSEFTVEKNTCIMYRFKHRSGKVYSPTATLPIFRCSTAVRVWVTIYSECGFTTWANRVTMRQAFGDSMNWCWFKSSSVVSQTGPNLYSNAIYKMMFIGCESYTVSGSSLRQWDYHRHPTFRLNNLKPIV